MVVAACVHRRLAEVVFEGFIMVRFSGFRLPGVVGLCALACGGGAVRGQCELGWVNDFGGAAEIPIEANDRTFEPRTIIDRMASLDPDGEGPLPPRLIVGGVFAEIGGVGAVSIAQWDGEAWSAMGPTFVVTPWDFPRVVDMLVHDDDGDGPLPPALYIATLGVKFDETSETVAYVLRWDGAGWTVLADSTQAEPGPAVALAFFDDGDGERLYASGPHSMLTRLEPEGWREIWPSWTQRATGRVLCPTRVRGQEVLAVLGRFELYDWNGDGLTSGAVGWNAPIQPSNDENPFEGVHLMGYGPVGTVQDAVEFDEDGDGPMPISLFAVGSFQFVANSPGPAHTGPTDIVPARNIARFDGERWHAVGPDPDRNWFYRGITAITVFDDGTGPALHAGSFFWYGQDSLIHGVAKWTGSEWVQVGKNFGKDEYLSGEHRMRFVDPGTQVRDLVVHPIGGGPAELFAAGSFQFADGLPASHIARRGKPFVRGDTNGDAAVDFGDVVAVLLNWLNEYPLENTGAGAANSDFRVDFADITFVLTHFGASCP